MEPVDGNIKQKGCKPKKEQRFLRRYCDESEGKGKTIEKDTTIFGTSLSRRIRGRLQKSGKAILAGVASRRPVPP
jgi:hypothetical protein